MISLKQLLYEAVDLDNLSPDALADAYNLALTNYNAVANKRINFQASIVKNAKLLAERGKDITRPMYAYTDYSADWPKDRKFKDKDKYVQEFKIAFDAYNRGEKAKFPGGSSDTHVIRRQNQVNKSQSSIDSYNKKYAEHIKQGKVQKAPVTWVEDLMNGKQSLIPPLKTSNIYLPGTGRYYERDEFYGIMKDLQNASPEEAYNIRTKYGIGESWGLDDDGDFQISTTDNTCAMYTCTVLDIAQSEIKSQLDPDKEAAYEGPFEIDSKNKTHDEWMEYINSTDNVYINTRGYMASPEKIWKSAVDNEDNWDKFDQSDFEGDPRSEEYWNTNIQPGDMIIYYDKKNPSDMVHIAIAGENTFELWHDGSSRHKVDKNSANRPHNADLLNRNFKIVRYTGGKNLTDTKNELTRIEEYINNHQNFNQSYQKNDQGAYELTVAPPVPKIEPEPLDTTTTDNTQIVPLPNTTDTENQFSPIEDRFPDQKNEPGKKVDHTTFTPKTKEKKNITKIFN